MKRQVKMLKEKSVDSLILSIEHFNRPWNKGRIEAVLILMDHAFELLLKASILHKGGKIRQKGDLNTYGFDRCVRVCLTDSKVKFLNEEQALTLQSINGLRDAAQHYLLDISESQLYIHAQSGVTLFRDICLDVFFEDITNDMPDRVLPISTHAPTDIAPLFSREVKEIKALLAPGKRKRIESRSKVRALAIFEDSIAGNKHQPTKSELDNICDRIRDGEDWSSLFPGVASLNFSSGGEGPSISLRFTKKDGIPIHVVPEGNNSDYPVAIKRVNELGFYNLGITEIASKLDVTVPKLLAVVKLLKVQENPDYFKLIKIQTQEHKRYSQKALIHLKTALTKLNLEEVWEEYKNRRQSK